MKPFAKFGIAIDAEWAFHPDWCERLLLPLVAWLERHFDLKSDRPIPSPDDPKLHDPRFSDYRFGPTEAAYANISIEVRSPEPLWVPHRLRVQLLPAYRGAKRHLARDYAFELAERFGAFYVAVLGLNSDHMVSNGGNSKPKPGWITLLKEGFYYGLPDDLGETQGQLRVIDTGAPVWDHNNLKCRKLHDAVAARMRSLEIQPALEHEWFAKQAELDRKEEEEYEYDDEDEEDEDGF